MEQSPGQTTIKDVTSPAPSSISVNDAKKKCNLSFYFNFDFDDINSDVSSDSETADLQIDVSEVDNYVPPNKHKRDAIEETSSVINEMEEEIERQLDAKAAKTNLTATNVKNIIKHVITNEYVMAMVKNRLQDTEDDILFEPKLTRAKAKELAAAQVNIPWPITRVPQPTSEVQVLIEEELPEDSSDEEYNPEQDKQSDDEREVEISTNTDVVSLSSTPANNCDSISIEQPKSPKIQYDPEGIFKIPCIPHVPTEEENIGQRTRSKLCLSETPLEQIEQAFIPPDITTDMYDWDCEIDEDWDNFLKEFTQPLTQEPVIEDDPEADPEYNILEDEETEFLDKEELRADKAVKVTRKELNTLIAELFEFTDTFSKQEQEISKKRRSPENLNSTIENNSLACSVTDLLPIYKEPEVPELMNANQRQLLAVQMCQHVQLMVQHFAMTYKHPELHFESKTCKQNLMSIQNLSNGPNSAFNAANVVDALKLASDWENKFLDNKFSEDFKKTVLDENTVNEIYSSNRWKYVPKFHPELKKLFMESKALMYPQLLPELPFKSGLNKYTRSPYLKSENVLIALGLEQFVPFVATKPRKFKSKKIQLMDALQLIIQYLLPCKEPRGLYNYVHKRRHAKDGNPIRHYFEKGYAPRTIHYIPRGCELKAPKEQPIECLPTEWQNYLSNTKQKIDALKRKHILNSYNNLMKKDNCLNGIVKTYTTVPIIHPLRNPIVNMFPKILPAPMNKKNPNKQTIKNTSYMTENVNSENSAKASSSELNIGSCSSDVVNTEQTSQRTNTLKSATHVEEKAKPLGKNKEEEDSWNDEITISTTSKHSKFSKKSSGVVQDLPELNIYSENSAKASSNELNTGSCSSDVVNTAQTSQRTNPLKSAMHVEGKTKLLEKNEEEEDSRNDEITISTTSKYSKFSKKSSGVVQELPEINVISENSAKASSDELNTGSCSSDVVNTEQTSQHSNPLKSATHVEGKTKLLEKNEEEEDSRNDEITISSTSMHSKFSKKSSGVVQDLPELNIYSENSAKVSSNELNTESCSSDVVNIEQTSQRTNPLKSAMHVEGKTKLLEKNEEEEDSRNDEITISTTSKFSKFSKKSSGVVQELPEINVISENSAKASSEELNTGSCSSDVVNTEQTSQHSNPLKSATHVEGKTKLLEKNEEEENSRNDEITISTTSKHSKFSKKSSGVVQELPEINVISENSAKASSEELNTGSCSSDVVNTEQTSQHSNPLKSATHVEGKTKLLEKNEEEENSRNDEITISTTSKHSKFSKKSSGVVPELQELNVISKNSAEASSNELNTGSCSSDVVNIEQTSQRTNPLKSAMQVEGKKRPLGKNEEEEDNRSDEITISTTSKLSKFSKKSSGVVQELPQLRRTTPRLAKTRSAQNMKLMAQVLGSKGLSSSCNNLKSREKNDMDKSFEKTQSLPKLDNEDEIAELMLASTTIKKDSLSRKKAKEAREIETIKRLLESENPLNEEERGSKFAASYLQKLHLTLEPNNPDLFRSVVKLYLDYYEKLDSINQMESELSFSNESGAPQNENIMEQTARDKDAIAINLYQDVCEKLHEYPELCTDFLLFLKPHQAAIMDKPVEYIMLQKMSEFINVAQIYFTKQPSRIAKMMQAITQLSSDPETTLEHVHTIMGPVLKGHPLVMDLFLQILPTAKPPESLFASHMFENLTCPVGPHDKNKLYTEDAPELYENIELPLSGSQEDPYGGENCRCNCHNGDDTICKSISEHCVSCGTRFLNGKIYLQTSEGLRPAKIIFPGADEEKLENIARVSLKTADKFVSPIPSRPRRKSSKNESHSDEQYQKPCVSKSSPVKDNEEIGKVIVKSKRNIKSPSKTDQKRGLKRLENTDRMDVNAKRVRLTQYKSKKEKKVDKQQTKLECIDSHIHHVKLDESSSTNTTSEMKKKVLSDGEGEISNDSANKTDSSDDVKISNTNVNIKLWTRQEDMILLQAIKKEYSDNSLVMVSKTLDRTIQQVKERCETLLALLQKMM